MSSCCHPQWTCWPQLGLNELKIILYRYDTNRINASEDVIFTNGITHNKHGFAPFNAAEDGKRKMMDVRITHWSEEN